MANLFDLHAQGLIKPLSQMRNMGSSLPVDAASMIAKNMDKPVSSGLGLTEIWGTPDIFLEKYKNINDTYLQLLDQELTAPGISEVKRRMLEVHKNAPSMNFRVLSYQNQQTMKEMLRGTDGMNIEALIAQHGAPGMLLPSENQYRLNGRILTDNSRGRHPFIEFLNSLHFSTDTRIPGINSIDIGYSNLPSYEALKSAYEQGPDLTKVMQQIQNSRRAAKLFIYDTETTGLGVFSKVRNLGAVSTTVNLSPSGAMQFGNMNTIISTHMASSEMAEMIAVQPGSRMKIPYSEYAFGKEKVLPTDELFDLSTKEGRLKSVNAYKNFFESALQHDYIVGHNINFDIQKVMMSASLIEEFHADDDAVRLMVDFAEKIKRGEVINTLDLLRGSQMQQALESARAAGLTGADADRFAEKLIGTVFSEKSLGKMGFANVAPASIENALLSSNLIDLIEADGTEGADLVKRLAAGKTHESITDAKITGYILRFVQNGDLRWGSPSTSPNANKAALAVMKSSAYVSTTSYSDVQEMTGAALRYSQTDEGMRGARIYDDARGEIISYNKNKKQWTGRRLGLDGSTIENIIPDSVAEPKVKAAIEASRLGNDSELFNFNFGFLQASRAEQVLDNVGVIASNISATVGSGAGRVRATASGLLAGGDTALDDAFIRALGSTQEEIGFNFYYDSHTLPSAMRQAMNEPFEVTSAAQKAAYVQRLAEGGIANSLLDPTIRRSAVEFARITSQVPYLNKNIDATGAVRRKITKKFEAEVAAGAMQQDQLDELISLSDEDFNAKYATAISTYNTNAAQVSRAAAELGGGFLQTQKSVQIFNRTGGISVIAIPEQIASQINVTVGGRQIGLSSDEFLKDRSLNRFRVSIAETENAKYANIVMGDHMADTKIERKMAQEISEQYLQILKDTIESTDEVDLLESGMFVSSEQVKEVRAALSTKESMDQMASDIADSISERGFIRATIGGDVGTAEYDVASALQTMVREKGEGIANDTKALSEGFEFEMTKVGKYSTELQIRVSDAEIGMIRTANPAVADFIEGTGASPSMAETVSEQRAALMERADADRAFAQRVIREDQIRSGTKRGVISTLLGRSADRDAELVAKYRRLKPKIGYGALAVGVLGAGYYINKKRKENNLYDETVEQQPYEKTGFVSQQNDGFVQINSPISSRRDPLTTAGVVGTLDRNKVGHTQMGPNKYNHLYGR
jgi:hypothetical protein